MLDGELSRKAYARGLAWADETFDFWLGSGRAVPLDLPLTEHDAMTLFGTTFDVDPMTRAQMVSLSFAAAALRWSRLVSLVAPPRRARLRAVSGDAA